MEKKKELQGFEKSIYLPNGKEEKKADTIIQWHKENPRIFKQINLLKLPDDVLRMIAKKDKECFKGLFEMGYNRSYTIEGYEILSKLLVYFAYGGKLEDLINLDNLLIIDNGSEISKDIYISSCFIEIRRQFEDLISSNDPKIAALWTFKMTNNRKNNAMKFTKASFRKRDPDFWVEYFKLVENEYEKLSNQSQQEFLDNLNSSFVSKYLKNLKDFTKIRETKFGKLFYLLHLIEHTKNLDEKQQYLNMLVKYSIEIKAWYPKEIIENNYLVGANETISMALKGLRHNLIPDLWNHWLEGTAEILFHDNYVSDINYASHAYNLKSDSIKLLKLERHHKRIKDKMIRIAEKLETEEVSEETIEIQNALLYKIEKLIESLKKEVKSYLKEPSMYKIWLDK